MGKIYEYAVHPLLTRGYHDTYVIDVIVDGGYCDLNEMGRDGWKLVSVIEDQEDTHLGIFVRSIVDATTQPLATQQVEGSTVTWRGDVPSDTSCEVMP